MSSIGVRELRQNASLYLERVRHGEILDVTNRGRLIARRVPVNSDTWTDMVASGKVTVADDRTAIEQEPPGDYDVDASATLTAMREHER